MEGVIAFLDFMVMIAVYTNGCLGMMTACRLIPDISRAKEKWPLDVTDGRLEATSDLTPAVGIPGTGSDAVSFTAFI